MEKTRDLNGLTKFLLSLVIIGALNWGLIGFFNWNLVDAIFGGGSREITSGFSRIIYAIVGLCGLGLAFVLPRLGEYDRTESRRRIGTTAAGDRRIENRI
jgi:hypothetical protein